MRFISEKSAEIGEVRIRRIDKGAVIYNSPGSVNLFEDLLVAISERHIPKIRQHTHRYPTRQLEITAHPPLSIHRLFTKISEIHKIKRSGYLSQYFFQKWTHRLFIFLVLGDFALIYDSKFFRLRKNTAVIFSPDFETPEIKYNGYLLPEIFQKWVPAVIDGGYF